MKDRLKLIAPLDNVLLFVWGLFLLTFPFIMSTLTTEGFVFPKQILLAAVVLISLILLGAKMVLSEQLRIRRTPFDVPLSLFTFALLLSALMSVNRIDALIAFIPTLLSVLAYFVLVNVLKKENAVVFGIAAIVIAGVGVSLLAVFSFLKVYPLPIPFTHVQSFTPLGSLLEQAVFLGVLGLFAAGLGMPVLKGDTKSKTITFAVSTIIIAAGFALTVFQLFTTQKPIILPFETGFQTAFAAISQDSGRIAQGFFFGAGFGNFAAAFTRFKQVSLNTNSALWFVPFTQSSSFILELLTTTGLIGTLSFLLLLFRVVIKPSTKKANPVFLPLVAIIIALFVLPFSFQGILLFFVLLALFSSVEAFKHPSKFSDIEPRFVALKKGLISLPHAEAVSSERREYGKVMPYLAASVLGLFTVISGVFIVKYVLSDLTFQTSLIAAAENNGTITYRNQVAAINLFPYRSSYYRVFSQTNIALANSISNAQPKGSSPSATVQQTVYTLIQQGINTGKMATTLSPQTVTNWQNLSSIYRALIGFGQNAENFAILASQQAVVLDPTNPQEYIALGGIYYQLGQYDNAIREFQLAANLKQDYANAYYNLGHAYLQKGDQQNAIAALQIVKQLSVNDKANYNQVSKEIDDISKAQQTTPQTQAQTQAKQNSLALPETSHLPAQATPIPLVSATPTPAK